MEASALRFHSAGRVLAQPLSQGEAACLRSNRLSIARHYQGHSAHIHQMTVRSRRPRAVQGDPVHIFVEHPRASYRTVSNRACQSSYQTSARRLQGRNQRLGFPTTAKACLLLDFQLTLLKTIVLTTLDKHRPSRSQQKGEAPWVCLRMLIKRGRPRCF